MLAFVWNWTHLRSADSTSIITDNIPQAVWNLWQRDRWTGSCQFQTTQFLLNYYLAVQGARRTSGSSMEICSVLQPMHCGFLVLGRLGLGHDWRACCTNTHSVAYVFSACHAGNTELWSWNWGTPSYNCCCKLLGSKQICLPHEQKKCSMRASMHRTITISEDKSGMSCGEHVIHPRRLKSIDCFQAWFYCFLSCNILVLGTLWETAKLPMRRIATGKC